MFYGIKMAADGSNGIRKRCSGGTNKGCKGTGWCLTTILTKSEMIRFGGGLNLGKYRENVRWRRDACAADKMEECLCDIWVVE